MMKSWSCRWRAFYPISVSGARWSFTATTIKQIGSAAGQNPALISPDREGGNVGIGFAIPSNVVREVIAQAVAGGS